MHAPIDNPPVPAASLDVVVLCGGGRVGLPLEAVLAESEILVTGAARAASEASTRAGLMPGRPPPRIPAGAHPPG